jgi:hypothetical protein
MPNVLEMDTVEELALDAEAVEEESWRVGSTDGAPDLADGGMVNGVRVRPARDKNVTKGRPAARRAWMANGTETLLPLAWEPDGRTHDSAARYFRKRLCLCCQRGGFKGRQCPDCVKKGCGLCNGSSNPKKIIPCFYRRKEDVPFPIKFYGSIDCFLVSCIRRGSQGFLTTADMRLHARSMHKLEYQAHLEGLEIDKQNEVAVLREELQAMRQLVMSRPAEPQKRERTPAQKRADQRFGEKARERRQDKVATRNQGK